MIAANSGSSGKIVPRPLALEMTVNSNAAQGETLFRHQDQEHAELSALLHELDVTDVNKSRQGDNCNTLSRRLAQLDDHTKAPKLGMAAKNCQAYLTYWN